LLLKQGLCFLEAAIEQQPYRGRDRALSFGNLPLLLSQHRDRETTLLRLRVTLYLLIASFFFLFFEERSRKRKNAA